MYFHVDQRMVWLQPWTDGKFWILVVCYSSMHYHRFPASDIALWTNSLTRVLSHVTTNNTSHTVSMLECQGGVHILAHLTTNHLRILDCWRTKWIWKFSCYKMFTFFFSWSGIPTKFRFYAPRCSDLKQDYTHQKVRRACCVHSRVCRYHAAVGELLVCEWE